MIPQTHPLLAGWINHYACLADCIAAYREFRMSKPWRVHEFGAAMHTAVDKGHISGDLNGDGNMDGVNEALLVNPQGFVDLLGLPLKYLGKFDQKDYDKFAGNRYWVVTSWRNPKTGFVHWVIGNKKPVQWDSIQGGSLTVANGAPYPLQADKTGGIMVFEVVA